MTFLKSRDISKKWATPTLNRGEVTPKHSIHFEGKVTLDLL